MNLGPSVLPSFRPEVFSELVYCFFFLKLCMMLVGLVRLGKIVPKWVKNRVFLILWNIVIFFWHWSEIKVYIIWCVAAQIPYLKKKILFLRCRPKCSRTIRLHIRLHIKKVPRRLPIIKPFTFLDMRTLHIHYVCLQTCRNNRIR